MKPASVMLPGATALALLCIPAIAAPEHWSFRPPVRPTVPETAGGAANGEIDRFLLAKLEPLGLRFAPEADRRTLIRRLSFDLTGLPPSPEETEWFVSDSASDAWPRLVDRLLDSPAYGERWAQHWLDVARFAESDGFELDAERPHAWRYRDWVIQALNTDLPYDRFVQLQLAGDEIAPDDSAARTATGFLLAGPDMPDINLTEERRHHLLNDMTAAVGGAFLGLTLGCAQCHDHRTDPLTIADIYSLRAIFANTVVHPARYKQLGAMVKEGSPEAPASFVMIRGDFSRPGPEVLPAFPAILNPDSAPVPPPPAGAVSSMRRAAFARWLTRPDHPLTGRVIMNRLWQHHFGRGLVATPGDFGHTGDRPSHPELLDWLATELPARGWSLKAMHRLVLTSRAWRQASMGSGPAWEAALRADPGAVWLSHMPRQRLEAEVIRDLFLAVSGRLNRRTGGPGVRPPLPAEVTSTILKGQWEVTPGEDEHRRRSIYLFARRNLRFPLFDIFDRPDSNLPCPRRDHSTTAPQALTLLNSEFSWQTAQSLAERISAHSDDPQQQTELAFLILFCHPPDPDEKELAYHFLAQGPGPDGLSRFCLALLNASRTIYVD